MRRKAVRPTDECSGMTREDTKRLQQAIRETPEPVTGPDDEGNRAQDELERLEVRGDAQG